MLGPGTASSGKACAHGPTSPLRGTESPARSSGHRVRVPVREAAHRIHRALDRGIVLADGAVLPVAVAALVPEPRLDVGRRPLQAVEPGLAPAVPEEPRVGRPRVPGEHGRGPVEHVEREHAAAAVMDVVGVAVVSRAERHDRLQCGRSERGDLERVEAAPRDAPHAHGARAPGLLREPRDHLERVLVLLLRVLVEQDPVGLAGPPHVHPHGRVAVAGDVRLPLSVAYGRAVVLAVREVLEDRRHGIVLGVLGKPDPRREPAAVRKRDPGVLDLADAPREVGADPRHSRHGV